MSTLLAPNQYFQKNGYYLFKNALDPALISEFLKEYQNVKSQRSRRLFFSQSTHEWRPLASSLDSSGKLTSSILNISDHIFFPRLSRLSRLILQSDEIQNMLRLIYPLSIPSGSRFNMWQNMLFEKSTATVDHVDTWYLDTFPLGLLTGCWIALEKITAKGGSFHVYPQSHLTPNPCPPTSSHDQLISIISKRKALYKKVSFYLEPGDVLFWHSHLIHGSSPFQDEASTRLSLTAHYHPTILPVIPGRTAQAFAATPFNRKLTRIRQRFFNRNSSLSLPITGRTSALHQLLWNLRGSFNYRFAPFLNAPHQLMSSSFYD